MQLVRDIRQYMEDNPKRANLLKSLFYFMVCTLCIFAATLAWFFNTKSADAGGLEFASVEAVGLYASLNGSDFKAEQRIEFPENLKMALVSGDGEGSMYYPVLPQGSGNADDAIQWLETDYDEDADENMFYRFTIYLHAYVPGYAVLSEVSVDPAAAPENRQGADYTNIAGDTVTVSGDVTRPVVGKLGFRLSENSATITKDYIAAAFRVGITNLGTVSGTIPKHFLVVPNGAMKLTDTTLSDVNTGELVHSLTMTENATGYENTALYHYNPQTGSKINYRAESLPYYFGDSISEDTPLYVLRLTENTDTGLYEGEVEVTLWIEGFDDEALDIFEGGEMSLALRFDYVEREAQ